MRPQVADADADDLPPLENVDLSAGPPQNDTEEDDDVSAKKKVAAAQAAEAAAEAEAARGRYNRDLEMAGEYNRSVRPEYHSSGSPY
jgi:hypothetical protein